MSLSKSNAPFPASGFLRPKNRGRFADELAFPAPDLAGAILKLDGQFTRSPIASHRRKSDGGFQIGRDIAILLCELAHYRRPTLLPNQAETPRPNLLRQRRRQRVRRGDRFRGRKRFDFCAGVCFQARSLGTEFPSRAAQRANRGVQPGFVIALLVARQLIRRVGCSQQERPGQERARDPGAQEEAPVH